MNPYDKCVAALGVASACAALALYALGCDGDYESDPYLAAIAREEAAAITASTGAALPDEYRIRWGALSRCWPEPGIITISERVRSDVDALREHVRHELGHLMHTIADD